jgi:hypothetical protein
VRLPFILILLAIAGYLKGDPAPTGNDYNHTLHFPWNIFGIVMFTAFVWGLIETFGREDESAR